MADISQQQSSNLSNAKLKTLQSDAAMSAHKQPIFLNELENLDQDEALAFIEGSLPAAAGNENQSTSIYAPLIESSDNAILALPDLNPQALSGTEPSSTVSLQAETGSGDLENLNSLLPSEAAPFLLETQVLNLIEDYQVAIDGVVSSSTAYKSVNQLETEHGFLSVDQNGAWSYTVNNESAHVQALGAGERLSETVEIVALNGATTQIDIWVHGTNDKPEISGDVRASVEEDQTTSGQIDLSGQLLINDLDFAESGFIPELSLEASYGSAQIDALGNWTYSLDNDASAVQGLNDGETLTDYFFTSSVDGTETKISITILGQEDIPVFSGTNFSILDMNTESQVGGKLNVRDADFGESYFIEQSGIAGNYGEGSINEMGFWSYELYSGLSESLSAFGTPFNDTFTVSSADGTSVTIIVRLESPNPVETTSVNIDQQLESALQNSFEPSIFSTENNGLPSSFDTLQGEMHNVNHVADTFSQLNALDPMNSNVQTQELI